MGEYKLGHAKQHAGSSVKYGTGHYDDHAHKGHGRQQENATRVTKGDHWDSPTPHAEKAVVRDGVQGKGDKKRGYQTDAHSGTHHYNGEAVGNKHDNRPFNWESPLHAEGKKNFISEDHGPNFVGNKADVNSNKAEHHPRAGEPHTFNRPPMKDAHGYGHGVNNRMGHLRLSGHSGGHMVGTKPTRKNPSYPSKGHNLIDR